MYNNKHSFLSWTIALLILISRPYTSYASTTVVDTKSSKTKATDTDNRIYDANEVSEYRLPPNIRPSSYNITIRPFFNNFTFSGEEMIDIIIDKSAIESNEWITIKLNAFDILINYCVLYIDTLQQAIPLKSAEVDMATQIVTLHFKMRKQEVLKYMSKHSLSKSMNAMLYISYIGIIQIDMKGFYISSFRYDGKLLHNAVTHFEATNARKFYPSFDEPSMKATFSFTVIAPKKAVVIGNALGHEYHTEHSGCYYVNHMGEHNDCKVVRFEKSPVMSTYLTALAIGDYQYVSGELSNKVEQRIYFPPQNPARATFALDISMKVLQYYESLLGLKFPLSKMYSLAVNDFKAGAMENLGLVTYRDIRLMCDVSLSTLSIKQHVALVIAHEFSHQWFGNLVTMKWWSDIWLNEGFAAFMEFVGANYVHPEFELWHLFYAETHRAMLRDASSATHPVVLRVEDPTDVRALFDGITYHKGAGVLHMLHEYLGADVFFSRVRAYLKKYQFGNANTREFLSEMGGEKIVKFMNSWLRQPGIPVVRVVIVPDSDDHESVSITVSQKRMHPQFGNGNDAGNDDDDGSDDSEQQTQQLWEIPMKIVSGSGAIKDLDLMSVPSQSVTMARSPYYLVNSNMSSFHFTYYDTMALNLIVKSFPKLGKVDQFLLVTDRFSLMHFHVISGDSYLKFIQEIVDLIDFGKSGNVNAMLWRTIIESLIYIDDLFCELYNSESSQLRELRVDFREFGKKILKPLWVALGGFEYRKGKETAETADVVSLRPLVLSALVRMNDIEVISEGHNILNSVIESNGGVFALDNDGYITLTDSIDNNILEQLFECGLSLQNAEHSDESIFDELIAIYADANNEIQSMVLGAIGAVYANSDLLQAGLEFVLSHSVRLNVKGHGMASLRRCYGRDLVWDDLLERARGVPRQAGMASTFASQKVYNQVYSYYFGDHNGLVLNMPNSKERIIKAVLEKIAMNIYWLNHNKFPIMKWLKEKQERKQVSSAHARVGGATDNKFKKRRKQQINNITRNTKVLSPRESLMIMITLFFVIIGCCLISLWLYSIHKNTLII